jgi:type IV pilus assembly protein PilA
MKNQKGFSLVELLVVVIIIAIIAAIAIPNLLASRRAANEASAVQSLRTIHSAQATFQATSGGGTNYAANLAALGPASSGPALIDETLAGGAKSGYNFVMAGAANAFCASGAPDGTSSGTRSFAVGEQGVVYQWATATGGPSACTGAVFASAGGTPVGGTATAAPPPES